MFAKGTVKEPNVHSHPLSCVNHFVEVNKMLCRPFCERVQNAHHVRGGYEDDAHHFREVTNMVSALRFASVLLFCALFAPVVHPDAERLTGAFLCERRAYQK